MNNAFAAPGFSTAVADDPDNLDAIYSVGDTITITFDAATNATAGNTMNNVAVVANFTFSFSNLATQGSISGSWASDTILVLTVDSVSGVSDPPNIDSTVITKAAGETKLGDGANDGEGITGSATLSGDFGLFIAVTGGGTCNGDCTTPTLGKDKNGIRVVENGFTYNGKSIDVERYYTPYPLITVQVGVPNKAVFKIYEGGGPGDVRHFELAFGLANGARIDTTDAAIVWDKTFGGMETVTLIDPENVLENVRVETTEGKCREVSTKNDCLIVTIDHTFRASLDFNMVGSHVWDENRNGWQNYYNDGIAIEGESLNPPKQHQGIHKGHLITITETGKNKATDENGNTWTFGTYRYPNTWKMDYIPNIVKDGLWKVMERHHSEFSKYKQDQVDIAESKLVTLCPDCFVESFEEINNIKFYEFPESMNKLDDPEIQRIAAYEEIRAMQILQKIMDPSLYNYND